MMEGIFFNKPVQKQWSMINLTYVTNQRACTLTSGKVCLLGSIEVEELNFVANKRACMFIRPIRVFIQDKHFEGTTHELIVITYWLLLYWTTQLQKVQVVLPVVEKPAFVEKIVCTRLVLQTSV